MPKNETKSGKGKAEDKKEVTPQEPAETIADVKTAPALEEEEMVEVSKTDLATFVKRLADLEASNKKLLEVADKGRMHQINEKERAGQRLLPTVKITRMGGAKGKMVIAWNMTKNQSYVDGNRLVEHQEMEVFFVDGTNETMPLITFYRTQNKDTVGKILSRTRDEDGGSEMLKLELPDGEILEIDLKFVN